MTTEEIIASLRHSHLCDVLVEGAGDVAIYSKIEEELFPHKIIFFPCGGRDILLEVAKNKSQFKHKVVFIADKDMWVFGEVPNEYADVFFTNGYCIENDLFTDGETLLNGLLSPTEKAYKNHLLDNLITWFAFEVEIAKQNPKNNHFANVNLLNDKYIGKKETNFREDFLAERNFYSPNITILAEIKEKYATQLRGKFLFQLWLKIFIDVRPKNTISYSQNQLWDMCFHIGKQQENSCINRIINHICHTFEISYITGN